MTSVTLGSGASGGIFSPSLFMGATLGAAYGLTLRAWFPGSAINPAVFALAGMAGLVGGATGAALTAIVMIFEMTLNYAVILPMTLTVAVSYGLRRLVLTDSIYTMKLARRGHVMPEALQANAHLVHHVADIAMCRAAVVPADMEATGLDLDERDDAPTHFVIVEDNRIVGVLSRDWALGHPGRLRSARIGAIAQHDYVIVAPETTVFDLLAGMQRSGASVAVVARRVADTANGSSHGWDVTGVVTKTDIAEALAEGMELFED